MAPAMRPRLVLIPLALLLVLPRGASAQGTWGELHLPGGVAAARRALNIGSADGRLDAGWLLDFTRLVYQFRSPGPLLDSFDEYLQYVGDVRVASQRWPTGCRLPSTTQADRDGIKRYLALLGVRLREERGRYVPELDRSEAALRHADWLAANGVDVTALVSELGAGRPAVVSMGESVLPLPLPAYWGHRVFEKDLLDASAIVADRSNALLYYGLMSLDDETLSYLDGNDSLVDFLRREASGAFSQFGRSLHVRDGKVQLPGDTGAAAIWQELAGAPASEPERFIRQLLSRDAGRLAFFYDVVSHLDPARQAFLLGAHVPGTARAAFVSNIYSQFKATDPTWVVSDRPFHRTEFDASLVAAFVDVQADGSFGPDWWPALLDGVTASEDWPDQPERAVQDLKPEAADARWLFAWIFGEGEQPAARWQLVRFAQRVFARAPRDKAPWIDSALRAFKDMPTLPLSIERMGVTDPVVYGTVARAAHALTVSGGRGDVAPVLGRWQAALALLEQIQRRRRFPSAKVEELLTSWAGAMPASPDRDRGAVAAWICEQLVPAVVAVPDSAGDLEPAAIVAFAGDPAAAHPRASWEGLDYVIDPGAPVAKGAIAIREARRLPRLGHLMVLDGLRRRFDRPLASLEQIKELAANLAAFEAVMAMLPPVNGDPPDIVSEFRDAVGVLQRITDARDLGRASRQLDVVRRALDALTDVVVPSLVYALALSPSEEPPAILAEAWSSHTLLPGVDDSRRRWTDVVWQLPKSEDRPGGGRRFRGAFLGLDLALADRQLRHVSAAAEPGAALADADKTALAQSVVMRDPSAFADASGREVTAALRTGRELVAGWLAAPPPRTVVREALRRTTADEWRANLILAEMTRDARRAFGELGLEELYQLGGGKDLPAAWGESAEPIDGCWCVNTNGGSARVTRGRGFGLAAAAQVDLQLRLVEHLSASKLPVALLPLLLPAAVQDWIDHTRQDAPDDWEALAAWPKQLPASRLEDYLLQLVANGTLAPPRSWSGDVRLPAV